MERSRRQEGLKAPKRQPKRGRLRLGDKSCIRRRPEYRNHVWSYDFVADRTDDGRPLRMLTVIDECSRECLAVEVQRKLTSQDVLDVLRDLFLERGSPEFIRSDNGSEFTSKADRGWLDRVAVKTLSIEPGSPWENGYSESFNVKLRDEHLGRAISYGLKGAEVLVESWRLEYNQARTHSALEYRPAAPLTTHPGPARI